VGPAPLIDLENILKYPLDDNRHNRYYEDVPGRLQSEIGQTRPFDLIEEEVALNVIRTAEVLQRSIAGFLKEYDLSPVQYNVLRILRGAGADGATCSQIGERLLTRDPDITRLLDRMEARGLIARRRSSQDRRVVITRLSKTGLALVNRIDQPLRAMSKAKLGNFGRDALAELISGLERMRDAYEEVTNERK
jgi:DNA-binding MarR family transcriptional regulator